MSQLSQQLATQLQLLRHANALLRRQAVFGCFQLIRGAQQLSAETSIDAIRECLSQVHVEVVQEVICQLPQLAALQRPGLDAAVLQQLLLDALPTATSSTAPQLAAGLLQLFLCLPDLHGQAADSATATTTSAGSLPAWSQHPLSVALQSNPNTLPVLLTGSCKLLAAAAALATAGHGTPLKLQCAWRSLQPFYSYILLGYSCNPATGSDGSHIPSIHHSTTAAATAAGAGIDSGNAAGAAAASGLVWQLVRLASSSEAVAQLVVPCLARHLAARPSCSVPDRQLLVNTCVDMVDLLDSHQPGSSSTTTTTSTTATSANSMGRWPLWYISSCVQVAQLLLVAALQTFNRSSRSSSTSRGESDVGTCLQQLQRVLVLLPRALPLSALPALGCQLMGLHSHQEQQQLLQLMVALLRQHAAGALPSQQQLFPGDAALLVLPILQCAVFSTSQAVKAWAAKVLGAAAQQCRQQPTAGVGIGGGSAAVFLASEELCGVACVQQVLQLLWLQPLEVSTATAGVQGSQPCSGASSTSAVGWCRSLQLQLQHMQQERRSSKAAAATPFSVPLQPAKGVRAQEAAGGQGGGPGAPLGLTGSVADLGPVWVLSALLAHPTHQVTEAAAAAVQQLLLVHPPAAVPVVPLVLWRLGQLVQHPSPTAARSVQALLEVLPAACADPTTTAIVQRALQPLTAPATATPLLKAASLQLTVQAWQTTGRGWSRAEAALNGCLRPGSAREMAPHLRKSEGDVQLPLRLMRAKALRDAADAGPGRVLDCICCIQDCLTDPRPAVAALAMEAVAVLTSDDTLDFYSVWQVVNQCLPPQQVLQAAGGTTVKPGGDAVDRGAVELACHLLQLLSYSAMDAKAEVERATAILQLLWAVALQHTHPKVRAAAVQSLTAFPLTLLEEMEVLPPLQDYVQPLLQEAAAMEALQGTQQQQQLQGLAAAAAQLQAVADQQAAVEAAEQLALLAVNREFEQRRRFMAAAGAASSAVSGGSAAAAGAEGAARQLLQLRHRLLHSLPTQLTSMAAADASATAPTAAAAAAAPGALLLLWQPRGTGVQAQALWQGVFQEVTQWAPGLSWSEPGLWATAWQSFMMRWQASTARPAESLLSQLRGLWQQGVPCQAVAACGAAAGLAAAGQLGEAQLEEVLLELLGMMKRPRATPVAAAAAAALARLLPALHPSDWTSRNNILSGLQQLLASSMGPATAVQHHQQQQYQQQHMGEEEDQGLEEDGSSSTSTSSKMELAAAAVEGLGHVGVVLLQQYIEEGNIAATTPTLQLAGTPSQQLPEALQLSCSSFKLLVSCLSAVVPAAGAALQQQLLGQLPTGLPDLLSSSNWTAAVSQEVTEGTLLVKRLWQSSLAVGNALACVTQSPALVTPLVTLVRQQWRQASQDPTSANASTQLLAAAAALPQAAAVGVSHDVLQPSELPGLLVATDSMLCAALTGCSYRAAAVAATAAGQLLAAALPHGVVQQQQVQLVMGHLEALSSGTSSNSSSSSSSSSHQQQPAAAQTASALSPAAATGAPAAVKVAAVVGLGAALGVDLLAGTSGCWAVDSSTSSSSGGAWSSSSLHLATGSLLPASSLSSSSSSAAPAHLSTAKAALRQLEAAAAVARKRGPLAQSTFDQRVKGASAWMLAAICQAAATAAGSTAGAVHSAAAARGSKRDGGSSSSSSADGAALVPLSVYPSAGVLRPLAERLLAANSCTPGAAGDAASAGLALGCSIARLLAGGPRLPAADWLPLCRRLLQPIPTSLPPPIATTTSTSAAPLPLQLQLAMLQLILSHCDTPALGLGAALDWLLAPSRFEQCHPALQQLLLEQLLRVLRALPINRGPALLGSLPGMVHTAAAATAAATPPPPPPPPPAGAAGGAGNSSSSKSSSSSSLQAASQQLQVAAWQGLEALCQAAGQKDPLFKDNKALLEAVHGAVADLLLQLPALPLLPPGVLLQLLQPQEPTPRKPTSTSSDQAEQQQQGVAAAATPLAVWSAALSCLSRLRPELLLRLTPLQPAPLLDALQRSTASSSSSSGKLAGAAAGAAGAAEDQDLATAFLRSCQLRAICVARQVLSWREIAEAWLLLLQLPVPLHGMALVSADTSSSSTFTNRLLQQPAVGDAGRSSSSSSSRFEFTMEQWDAVLPFVAAAACTLPQSAQVQLLQDLASGAVVCGQASSAAVLIAALVAAWCRPPAGVQSNSVVNAVDQELTGCYGHLALGVEAVLQALPCSVLQLLSQPLWQGTALAVCQALQQLMQLNAGSQPGVVATSLKAVVLAVARSHLPGHTTVGGVWEALSCQLCT